MLRLIARKILWMLLLLPVLHALGFYYATLYVTFLRRSETYRQLPLMGAGRPGGDFSYWLYVRQLLAGHVGMINQTPITQVIAEPLRNSLILLGVALLVTIVLGPLLGYLSVSRRTGRVRALPLLVLTAGASLPGFFLGTTALALIIYGSMFVPGAGTVWPLGGYGLDRRLVLPVLTLAIRPMLQVARMTASLLEHEFQQDYMRVARSKGLPWNILLTRHAFRNAVAPVVTTIGQSMRLLIGGLIIVEILFRWPGLGRVFAIIVGIRMDGQPPLGFFANPQLMALVVFVFGALLLTAELLSSSIACWSDPRLRRSSGTQALA